MSGASNRGILRVPSFPRVDGAQPVPGTAFNQAMAGIERAISQAPYGLGGLGWSWGAAHGFVVADTYTLIGYAPYPGIFSGMRAVVGPSAVGSLTETLAINGTPVTGVSGVTVNLATVQSFTATATRTFAAGDKITLVVAIASGVPVGAWSTALFTKT